MLYDAKGHGEVVDNIKVCDKGRLKKTLYQETDHLANWHLG